MDITAIKNSNISPDLKRKGSFIAALSGAPRRQPEYLNSTDEDSINAVNKLKQLLNVYPDNTVDSIQKSIVNHVEHTLACNRFNLGPTDFYRGAAYSLRDRLVENLQDTKIFFFDADVRRCYYLSLEFLIGRVMQNALVNMELEAEYKIALEGLGLKLESLLEIEKDPALGNGGLGRLAACFLDSTASLNLPVWGYGIRYTYGIFEQKIIDGRQVEHPDYWLVHTNPWEIERQDCSYVVRFYGNVDYNEKTKKYSWKGGEIVQAVAHDNPIPGFDTFNTLNLRLWKATPSKEFDFDLFNGGRFMEAVKERQKAEAITAVLYPNDNTNEGKELRLKQQYFFVCATIQDILRRFKKNKNHNWDDLPNKICIQLNDTHPTVAIPEFMRLLIDIEQLPWDYAWSLTKQSINYTNHTVLPEALEKWPVSLFEKLLPRHLLIINDINFNFLNEVRNVFGNDYSKISNMSIYEEGYEKKIRMANLAVIGSKTVNGVAQIHTNLVKRDLFPNFVEFYNKKGEPNKFVNVTNGVTQRRWLYCSNRPLSNLITNWLGSDSWLKRFDMISGIINHINNKEKQEKWRAAKRENKLKLAMYIKKQTGIELNVDTMLFDIQVKRIHEYKRQLLFCFFVIHRYLTIKNMSKEERKNLQPRACLMGGKAAPGYFVAKTIIKLFNNLSTIINKDTDANEYLKVVFIENYNVSNAQIIIPASDVSEHISTAGTEASGTSNMKFVINGGLIVGTLDGANVEIVEECGENSMFIFGALEHDVERIRKKIRDCPEDKNLIDRRLKAVFDFIYSGKVSLGDDITHKEFCGLINNLCIKGNGSCGDHYLVINDFPDYIRIQDMVDNEYKNKENWTKRCIHCVSCMGKFSSDRTIEDYAVNVWNLEKAARPDPRLFKPVDIKNNVTTSNEPIVNSASETNDLKKNEKYNELTQRKNDDESFGSKNISYSPEKKKINDDFLVSIKKDDMKMFKKLLKSPYLDINYHNQYGENALDLVVVKTKNVQMVLDIVNSNVFIDSNKNSLKDTVLYRSIDIYLITLDPNLGKIIEILLSSKYKPRVSELSLYTAAECNNLFMFTLLIKNFEDKNFFKNNSIKILQSAGKLTIDEQTFNFEFLDYIIKEMIKLFGFKLTLESCIKSIPNFIKAETSYGYDLMENLVIPLVDSKLTKNEIIETFNLVINDNDEDSLPGLWKIEATKTYLQEQYINSSNTMN